MTKVLVLGLLASAMIFNAGCTDDELTAGAVGVIIGAGLNDDGPHYGHPHPHRRWDAQVSSGSVSANIFGQEAASVETSSNVADFAAKNNISVDAAQKIHDALNGIQSQGLSSLSQIGLQRKDLESIAARSVPETSSIQAMAAKLDMSEAQARDLLTSMTQQFTMQAADVNSPYWQSCMAKGQWKTPENNYCASTSWTGCSPDAGASLCF